MSSNILIKDLFYPPSSPQHGPARRERDRQWAACHPAAQAGAPPASPSQAAAVTAPSSPEVLRNTERSSLDTLTISPTRRERRIIVVKCKVTIKDKNQKTKAWCLGPTLLCRFIVLGFKLSHRSLTGFVQVMRIIFDQLGTTSNSRSSQDGQLIFALESKARLPQGSRCHPTAGDVTTFSCKNVVHEFGFQLQGGDCGELGWIQGALYP